MATMTSRRFVAACAIWLLSLSAMAKDSPKPPFTVRDSIEMTRVVPLRAPLPGVEEVAHFSPDQQRFVIHTLRGDLARDALIESLLMYRTPDLTELLNTNGAGPPRPMLLTELSTTHDFGRVSALRWINDREVGFIAEGSNGRPQMYSIEVDTQRQEQITHHEAGVAAFAVLKNVIAYYAYSGNSTGQPKIQSVGDRTLPELLLPEVWHNWDTSPLRLQISRRDAEDGAKISIGPPTYLTTDRQQIWISPSGHYAVTFARAVNWPSYWDAYRIPYGDLFGWQADKMETDAASPSALFRTRYQIVDLRTGLAKPLIDAPDGYLSGNATPPEVFWSSDEKSVIVSNTYLPLKGVVGAEFERRRQGPAIAEIDLDTGASRAIFWEPISTPEIKSGKTAIEPIVSLNWDPRAMRIDLVRRRSGGQLLRTTVERIGRDWKQRTMHSRTGTSTPVTVELRQSALERPKIYVSSSACSCTKEMFDPNPQAERFNFGAAQTVSWTDANDITWRAGLILPTDYVAGRNYPLVVQTHGYQSSEFLADGPVGGTTAFAAQPLANAGIMVLQVPDTPAATTTDEREGSLYAEGYRAGIRKLMAEGLVDGSRVGLIAFSRTGLGAMSLMAESPELLAAVTFADTSDYSYVTHGVLLVNYSDKDSVEQLRKSAGGSPEDMGFCRWFESMPLYKLSRARAAVRIEALGPASLLSHWESYAVLKNAHHAVDLAYFPDGSHVLQKPQERLASQGGNVDWFRFWLQGYEDPAVEKAEQYRQWRELWSVHKNK